MLTRSIVLQSRSFNGAPYKALLYSRSGMHCALMLILHKERLHVLQGNIAPELAAHSLECSDEVFSETNFICRDGK